jgi:hypothetical protein
MLPVGDAVQTGSSLAVAARIGLHFLPGQESDFIMKKYPRYEKEKKGKKGVKSTLLTP